MDSRSDIAWKNANYAQIWEYLRDEYELTQRFGNLDFKLKFVEVRLVVWCRKFSGWMKVFMVVCFCISDACDIFEIGSTTSGFFRRSFRTGSRIFWNGLLSSWSVWRYWYLFITSSRSRCSADPEHGTREVFWPWILRCPQCHWQPQSICKGE